MEKNISEVLEKLAEQLGITVVNIYPYFIKQQIIEGYMFIFLTLFVMIVSGVIVKTNYDKAVWGDDILDKHAILILLATVVLCASIIVFLIEITAAVSKIINPEFGAINKIVSLVR